MRCLIKLEVLKDQVYAPDYHANLQGVVYNLLREAGHEELHDKKPFKFLTFSNIFPPSDMQRGDRRHLIISSPSQPFIESIEEELENRERLEPGSQQFRVQETSSFEVSPDKNGTMITGTPIVVRMDPDEAEEYDIDPGNYDKVYWRKEHTSQAFIDHLERNLAAKYERYYDRDAPERPYFTGYKLRKQLSVPLQYEDQDVTVIGTTWELDYECPNREMFRIIKLAYDTGLGELNTTGFGFMNKVDD
jgi:CRISPR-associated endoribonuclease Cas6